EQFPTLAGARGYYGGLVSLHGLTRGQGNCPGSAVGEGTYNQGGPTVGRVACYRLDDGTPTVVWTNEPLRVVATMIGTKATPKRLLAVWKEAGPYRRS
ncbi:MAG: hypothetical protein AB1416_07630, partial [Actinomycetota bacterium]